MTAVTAAPAVPAGRPLLYTIPEAMTMLRLSRSVLYEQIRAGRLRIVKQGRSTRVPAGALSAYVALLEAEADMPTPAGGAA